MTHTEKVALAMAWYDSGLEDRAAFQTLMESLFAQPEQDPVAWIERDIQCDDFDPDSVTFEKPRIAASSGREWVPLYTAPPQRTWVDLTDTQIEQVYFEVKQVHLGAPMPWGQVQFGKALLEKFKEVNQ